MSESTAANVNALIGQLAHKDASHEADRAAILEAAQNIVAQFEDPVGKALNCMFSFSGFPCACIAADLGMFQLLAEGGKTIPSLAAATKCDELLMVRVMRNLEAMEICKMQHDGIYVLTPMGQCLAIPSLTDGIKLCFEVGYGSSAKLPAFFRERGYKNPGDLVDGPFQYAHQTPLSYFDWLQQNERVFRNFNNFMTGYKAQKKPWVDLFPAEEVIWEGLPEGDSVTVVDVGGGYGHDLMLLKSKFARVPQRLVVQDLPKVLENAPDDSKANLETMSYNFFEEQPIKGARAYVFKNILHDWPENLAVEILRKVAAAMKPGYSRVLLVDSILSESTRSPFMAGLDIMMMVVFASLERTETQWEALLTAAGLKKGRVWTMPDGDSMIEGIKV